MLSYQPYIVHQYGWMPFLVWRNIKATVFGSWSLHIQAAALLAWTALLHNTSMVDSVDLKGFVKIWGTIYVGERPNPCPCLLCCKRRRAACLLSTQLQQLTANICQLWEWQVSA